MPRKASNLYKRNGVWWGRLKLAGREYRRSLRTTDPREAARRLKGWRLKLEREAVGSPDSPTWQAAVVRWAREVLPQAVKPNVAKRYLVSIGQLERIFGSLRVDQITGQRIAEYIGLRSSEASNATVRRDLTALSRLLSACVAWGWRIDNPARSYDRSIIRERRDPISPPADDDVAKLIAAAPPGMAAILRLLDQTGMRENEAVTLEAADLDCQARQIRLLRTKTNRPRTLDWRTPGGDATVILAAAPTEGALFRAGTGKPYRNFAANAVQVMRRLEGHDKAFRAFRVHDLRHRFAIRWLRNGGDIYHLSLHLGHTSLKTTEVYLGHLTARERAVAQSKVAAERNPQVAQMGAQRDIGG
jgi:integrase